MKPTVTGWHSIAEVWQEAWRPPDELKAWQWVDKFVRVDNTSQFQGQPQTEIAPWTREPMEVIADDSVRQVNVMCSAQSGKTQLMLGLLCWLIDNAPGPTLWFTSTREEKKTFAKTRMNPTFDNCERVARHYPGPQRRNAKTMFEIDFLHMSLGVYAANSIASVRGKPARWLFMDEVTAWTTESAFDEVLRRVNAWDNSRVCVLSTPKLWDDNVHHGYLAGDRREYCVPCEACGARWPLEMKQLRWDRNERTKPHNEEWNFDALAVTIRYECPNCGHAHKDVGSTRRHFAENGVWVAQNPNAPKNKVSFHWNALLPPWVTWRSLVEKFIAANEAKKKGNIEPLKAFVTHELGEPFVNKIGDGDDFKIPCGAYQRGDKWPLAIFTFMTVDVQEDHFWVVIRAWARTGQSRLIYAGRVDSEDTLRELQVAHGVKNSNVYLDYGNFWTRVARTCAKYGWQMLRGQDRQGFRHSKGHGKYITRAYSPKIPVDAYKGTAHANQTAGVVYLYDWSNPLVKDATYSLSVGQGATWELYEDVDPNYLEQVYKSEAKVQTRDKRTGRVRWIWINEAGRPNHLWDCENMQTVCALRAKLLGKSADDDGENDGAEADEVVKAGRTAKPE